MSRDFEKGRPMSAENLSEFEKARARKLGQQLRDKIEEYFYREMTDAEHAEVRGLRKELERMGFEVEWVAGFSIDVATGELTSHVEVTLLIPREKPEGSDTKPPEGEPS